MKLKDQAMAAFKAPFRHIRGYIWDSASQMVLDDCVEDAAVPTMRVRGWGYLQKLPDGDKVQDHMGEVVADALTLYWELSEILKTPGAVVEFHTHILYGNHIYCKVGERYAKAVKSPTRPDQGFGEALAEVHAIVRGAAHGDSSTS